MRLGKKKNYFLDLHKSWIKNKRMDAVGLCYAIEKYQKIFEKFHPMGEDFLQLIRENKHTVYWGSNSMYPKWGEYTGLRQTIVLFCHEILNS